jgi:hypothetical protein
MTPRVNLDRCCTCKKLSEKVMFFSARNAAKGWLKHVHLHIFVGFAPLRETFQAAIKM